ncbi:MAG: hypothetical protein HY757_09550 [Nitrospirae bacterium]|nr:hypothetical protein [Nitrospirota bacterium]
MKKLVMLAMCISLLSGCITAITPVSSNVPVDSSEIAKSELIGEDCVSYYFIFGPFGDASIKHVIDKNPGKKITLIDYEWSAFPFFRSFCSKVYGY